MVCSIYKITNKVNSKKYVGQTWYTLAHRFSDHCTQKSSPKLGNAIHKYGRDNFVIELLGLCYSQEDADNMEDFFIDNLQTRKNGYNIKQGGSHGLHSEESKAKMSRSHKGIVNHTSLHTSETKQKISKSKLENMTLEIRNKLSNALKGNNNHLGSSHSIESKIKIAMAKTKLTVEQRESIRQDKRSKKDIMNEYGISRTTIYDIQHNKGVL